MKTTITLVACIIGTVIIAAVVFNGINKSEVVECNQWAQQADVYPGFYLTKWQSEQCKAHGLTINSPVK